jgi:chloramphenicol-sensitive protein RarD
MLAVAAAVIAVNWGTYIYGVNSGQVVQASLGYFINPIVTVALGVLVLGERLRRTQWVAIAIGAVAVVVLTIDYGGPPWIALTLAFSFGVYGLVKNRVGRGVGALTSLTVETAVLAPVALVVLLWLGASGSSTFTTEGTSHALLLVTTGLVTAVPLLFFASAARRVPLTTIGLLQYLAPVLQFTIGVLVFRETMPPSRWAGFALVWTALVVLTADTLRSSRARARLARAAEAAAT